MKRLIVAVLCVVALYGCDLDDEIDTIQSVTGEAVLAGYGENEVDYITYRFYAVDGNDVYASVRFSPPLKYDTVLLQNLEDALDANYNTEYGYSVVVKSTFGEHLNLYRDAGE